MIAGIWAEDAQGLIGSNGVLPWFLPSELQHFKQTTMGQVILMGRKTFEGMHKRVLPGRTTIVMTRDETYQVDNDAVLVFHSPSAVLDWYQSQNPETAKNLYVTGGAEMFVAFKDSFDRLYRTIIAGTFAGDTYFPKVLAFDRFTEVSSVKHPADDKNDYAFTVKRYEIKR
ncbi:dihydrofolate reductase [Pseudolactococcus reticulitermitis]|uniref:Dihydrofolate reductase n=1 Tax=Pseudolactococcus reticulitermitis TaxID=2025039 RepID=A0A224X4I9_9LACT|nr:dihydrofolate reductase [Lactococcus reticulitermitis]GAX47596.1 dihydrofolate reductase [Lactococcus reticulitermitis]